jgi:DNA-binding SARP family transcriptional activator/tetratricopeptide (TPR) repeat protein/energy-coupling factor transporter ATP-binding protein EcfA2
MGGVRLHLTGRLRLEGDSGFVAGTDVPGRQARLVLAVLMWDPHPVARDVLAEVVWGEQLPASWRRDLSALVSKLRATLARAGLAPELIASSGGCYQLARAADTWVDVEAAGAELAVAEDALSKRQFDAARAASTVAADLARRPLLPGEDNLWLDARRAELNGIAVRALEVLAEASAAGGDLAGAVRRAVEVVALEPFRESGYVRLMRLLLASGDGAEALRVHERCRKLLAEELGASPSAELEEAYLAALGTEREDAPAGTNWGQPPLPAPLSVSSQGPLCGRTGELAKLEGCWRDAQAGRCRMVVVTGEAGAGKTRLVAGLAGLVVREGGTVVYGACDEEGFVPYQPFLEALRGWLASMPTVTLESIDDDVLAELFRLLPELANRLPGLALPVSVDPETQRFGLFDGVRRLLGAMAEHRAVLVVLDDLHWADQASLGLLRHVVRDLEPHKVLMVAVSRDEVARGQTPPPLLDDARLPEEWVVRVAVGDLGEKAVAEVMADLLHRDLSSDEAHLARLVHRATDGNPFFVTQVVRQLVEAAGTAGQLTTEPGSVERAVPDTVKQAIQLRLARLSAPTHELLGRAAVLGREFDVGLLALTAEIDEARLLDALDEAVAAHIVAEAPVVLDRYQFVHSLVRQVLYEQLSASRRARLHHRVGEALEASWAADPDSHAAELAHHFAASAALGDGERAVDYAARAGARALAQVAWEDAVGEYQRALAALEHCRAPDHARRCELLLLLGESMWRLGHVADGKEVFRQAAEVAVEHGRAEDLAQAALGLGGPFVNFNTTVDDHELIDLLEQALAHPELGNGPLRARLGARLAEALSFVGSRERRVQLARDAISLARRLGDPATLAFVLAHCHWPLAEADTLAERLAMTAETIILAEGLHDRTAALEGRFWHLSYLVEAGDLVAARAELSEAVRLTGELRQPYPLWMLTAVQCLLALLAGEYADAERLADQALAFGQQAQNTNALHLWGSQVLVLMRDRGQLEGLEVAVRSFVEEYPSLVAWRCALAWVHAELGRLDDARAELDQLAGSGFDDLSRGPLWLLSMGALAEVCATVDDVDRAEVLYERLRPYQDRWITMVSISLGSIGRILGRLAATLGRFEDADRHFGAAAAAHTRAGAHPWLAYTQADWAAALITGARPGDRDRATELAQQSRRIATELGMRQLLDRLDGIDESCAALPPAPV